MPMLFPFSFHSITAKLQTDSAYNRSRKTKLLHVLASFFYKAERHRKNNKREKKTEEMIVPSHFFDCEKGIIIINERQERV